MVKLALASTFVAGAKAGTLAVTWEDCGAKHATVTDLQPTTMETGSTTTLTGTGTCDEEVTSAHFEASVSAAGAKLTSCSGDATADIVCKLPLGAGTITVKAVSYPLVAGQVNIPVDVKTSSLIPASLAKVDVHIAATEQNGEDVICLDVHTAKQDQIQAVAADLPTGLVVEDVADLEKQFENTKQLEKEFFEGDYVSDLNVTWGMTNCNQICSNWCWATSATMCASAFGGGSSCSTEEAECATHEFGKSCDTSCSSSCNQGGTPSQISDAIKYLSGHSYTTSGALSQSGLDSALRHGPVVVCVYWSTSGGHAITISSGSGGSYKGHDPEGYAINTNYAGLTTYKPPYGGTGSWGYSVYTNSGAADPVTV